MSKAVIEENELENKPTTSGEVVVSTRRVVKIDGDELTDQVKAAFGEAAVEFNPPVTTENADANDHQAELVGKDGSCCGCTIF